MINQKELDKIRDNPISEIRKRIRKALQGNVNLQRCIVDGVIFNDFHCIRGTLISHDKYILEFKISKNLYRR